MNESTLPIPELLVACFGVLMILAAVSLIRLFKNWLLQHLAVRRALFMLVGGLVGGFLGIFLSSAATILSAASLPSGD